MRKINPRKPLKLVAWPVIIVLVSGIGYIVQQRLAVPIPVLKPHISYVVGTAKPTTAPDWPATGQAAVGASGYGVLASSGAQNPVPTASIAKLITVLAVLKAKPMPAGGPGATLTLSQADVDFYNQYVTSNGSVVPVNVGEQISEYQMMEAMLLPSANNMADSLATWAFGSLSAYATYANQLVASLGLTQTHVGSDASGFSADTTSTASDLVRLGEIAVADPVIAGITDRSTAYIPVAGTVRNVNWLLGKSSINGLKTGNSDQDPGAFLFSAPYQVANGHTITIIGAVLMAPDLSSAITSGYDLLTSAQKGFGALTELSAGQTIAHYTSPWSGTSTAVSARPVQSLTWQGTVLSKPSVSVNTVKTPQLTGATVGSISSGSDTIPITLTQPLPAPSIWWRLTHN